MEGKFTSKEIYEYLEEQKSQNITKTKQMSLYHRATEKIVENDEYSLNIWLYYINLWIEITNDLSGAFEAFKLMRFRFYNFIAYWKNYVNFKIQNDSKNLEKFLQQSIDFVKIKEFKQKNDVLSYLMNMKDSRGKNNKIENTNENLENIEKRENFFEKLTRKKYSAEKGINSPVAKKEKFFINDDKKIELTPYVSTPTSIWDTPNQILNNNFSEITLNENKKNENKIVNSKTILNNNFSEIILNENKKNENKIVNSKTILNNNFSEITLNENKKNENKIVNSKTILNNNFSEIILNENTKMVNSKTILNNNIEKISVKCNDVRFMNSSVDLTHGKLKFSPNSIKKPWSGTNGSTKMLPGINISLDQGNYTLEVTDAIKNLVKSKSSANRTASPKKNEIKIRERILINEKEIEILKQIGKGGSSKVYSVLYENEIYALKTVDLVGDENMLKLYLNEINLLYKLINCNEIIRIIDHEKKNDCLYILLEYGEIDLARMMKTRRLTINFIRDVWEQMLLIMKVLHRERVIHRDLKPANFLFVKGRLKLIDFGISKVLRNDTTSVLTDEQCGTINYMSPEVATQTNSRVSRSSDIWSLGCILYEMIHGKPPLHNYKNIVQKIQKLQDSCEFTYTTKYKSAVEVMKRCLTKEPKKRPNIDSLLNDRFLKNDEITM